MTTHTTFTRCPELEELAEVLSRLTGWKWHILDSEGTLLTQPAPHLIVSAWRLRGRTYVRFELVDAGKVETLGFGVDFEALDAYERAAFKARASMRAQPSRVRAVAARGREHGPDCAMYSRQRYAQERQDCCDALSPWFHNLDGEYR